jgi:tetratricopeptide (TPR) repeat protein
LKLFMELAGVYAEMNQNDKAADTLRQALDERPSKKKEYSILISLGDIYLKDNEFAKSIEYYQKASSLMKYHEDAYIKLAKAYEQSELYELAHQQYIGVLKRNKKSLKANFGLGTLYLKQKMFSKALEYFRVALTVKPDADIYRGMASCAENMGDTALAIAMLRQVIPDQRNYNDLIDLGRLYQESKRVKEAEESFSQAINKNPENSEAYIYLGLLYLEDNNLLPAEKIIQIAQEKAPDEGIVHFILGGIYYRQNNFTEAIKEIELAKTLAKTEILKNYSNKFKDFLYGESGK